MKLESQVVSLEIAKKLKELGVKQESLFAYYKGMENPDEYYVDIKEEDIDNGISAFTVAELGEMLPKEYYSQFCYPERKDDGRWSCKRMPHPIYQTDPTWFVAKTEADARGKMLIYLLENKLMEIPK